MPTEIECPKCQGTGWILTAFDSNTAERCSCKLTVSDEDRISAIGVPARFASATFEDFKTPSRELDEEAFNTLTDAKLVAYAYSDEFPGWVPERERVPRHGVLLYGGSEYSMAYLAVAALKRLSERGLDCMFCDYVTLLDAIAGQNSRDEPVSERSRAIVHRAHEADVLALAAVGAKVGAEWLRDSVGALLRERYYRMRGLILTSSYGVEGHVVTGQQMQHTWDGRPPIATTLADRIGGESTSLLLEFCVPIGMAAPTAGR